MAANMLGLGGYSGDEEEEEQRNVQDVKESRSPVCNFCAAELD